MPCNPIAPHDPTARLALATAPQAFRARHLARCGDAAPGRRARRRLRIGHDTDGAVIDLVRPHLRTSCCTIVTGYQDFFSSLSILMREVPERACDDGTTIRIAFGMNTANADRLSGRGRSVPEATRQHFLGKHGLSVDDAADLGAVLAIDAVRAGRIDLRLFDPDRAADCPFRVIRPLVPTTSAHLYRAIRPPMVCRVEA